ncbi:MULTISPECIES: helix-turn-helix transcriptional regulator [unclassified Herbaspirillum]|uniref:helix-turn-helix transcriptional regulator n=1 Tax=unclassified Herbaspirillum TaxID=2624150 RepID=UPI00114ECDFE|nr:MULTISPECIES: helix-turn-helix transcriptional regulator [unclassified Herbaspirillum]MBB5393455.1 transcriptional regulator with XRE-family HTH domain [Herbaspirillum sp. SJZ102]TQK03797.1 helix-turn-helix protein [Herbaspirillum sp. SJZ130]TQK08529.1 helix-turn-helix protein [Herbaspirillum sp. SJZ106]TWC71800.1 helix-turn-helix protein [Herbaspirillum sp. SJZ099]
MASILDIGEQIRRARKARKLSAVELAAQAGIHRNTLLALETGKGNIELARLLAICSELELELELVPQAVARLRRADADAAGAGSMTELSEQLHGLMHKRSRP